jgi:hypothetical protein
MIVEMGLTEFVPMICQWKLQSEDDIYDSITDWDYHEYRCIMKDGKEAIANGIADEGFDGHCCTYIDFYEDKYNVDDIVYWCEVPKSPDLDVLERYGVDKVKTVIKDYSEGFIKELKNGKQTK